MTIVSRLVLWVSLIVERCQPAPDCRLPPCNVDRQAWASRCILSGECMLIHCPGDDAPEKVCR